MFLSVFYNPFMPSLLKSRRGVSGLEYLALAILIMLGILLGGPYLMRAINAPFKTIEDGSLQSERENIKQGNETPVSMPACVCSDFIEAGCGDGNGCAKTKKLFRRTCNPAGCEVDLIAAGIITVMQECRDDSSVNSPCCLPAQSTGNCGILASHMPSGCNPNEMEVREMCGSPIPVARYRCVADPSCINGCQPYGDHVAGWCPGHNVGIVGSVTPRFVENGHCNDDQDMKCKAECDASTYPTAGGCQLRCPNSVCEDGLQGRADFGENHTNCPQDCQLTAGGWYNNMNTQTNCPHTISMTCSTFCATLGLNSNVEPESDMNCASGENRRARGAGSENINYRFGGGGVGWGGRNTRDLITANQTWCYHAGQKMDWDTGDLEVACFCGTEPGPRPPPPTCPNGTCDAFACETTATCPLDCSCGNHTCDIDETNGSCPQDCDPPWENPGGG